MSITRYIELGGNRNKERDPYTYHKGSILPLCICHDDGHREKSDRRTLCIIYVGIVGFPSYPRISCVSLSSDEGKKKKKVEPKPSGSPQPSPAWPYKAKVGTFSSFLLDVSLSVDGLAIEGSPL
jgi:hypothetical protein